MTDLSALKQEEPVTLPAGPSLSLRDISPRGGDKGAGAKAAEPTLSLCDISLKGGDEETGEAVTEAITQMAQTMGQMQLIMASMAEMISATSQSVADLRRQVQRMDKATPAQAAAIRDAIHTRAAALCADYGCAGCEKKVAAAIRKSLRISTGVSSLREISKDHVKAALLQVETWDDFGIMTRMGAG
jgi:hypothetical protein